MKSLLYTRQGWADFACGPSSRRLHALASKRFCQALLRPFRLAGSSAVPRAPSEHPVAPSTAGRNARSGSTSCTHPGHEYAPRQLLRRAYIQRAAADACAPNLIGASVTSPRSSGASRSLIRRDEGGVVTSMNVEVAGKLISFSDSPASAARFTSIISTEPRPFDDRPVGFSRDSVVDVARNGKELKQPAVR